MRPIMIEELAAFVKEDSVGTIYEQVERLRKLRQLDKTAYTRAKVNLPFFCVSSFKENTVAQTIFTDIYIMHIYLWISPHFFLSDNFCI